MRSTADLIALEVDDPAPKRIAVVQDGIPVIFIELVSISGHACQFKQQSITEVVSGKISKAHTAGPELEAA